MIKKIGYYYPFTIPGTVIFGLIMYLIGAGYTQNNPYALFISFMGLFVLAVLITLSRIQAYRLGKEQLAWDASSPLYSGRDGGAQRFYTGSFGSWFFFRVHVRVRGKLKLGSGAFLRVLRESAFTGNGALELPLRFQCSGTFSGTGIYSIKDVFGLVRAGAGGPVTRTLPVQPSLLSEEMPLRIDISGGEDDTQPRKSSDQEKYYQREYMPGDRFRDVNWKATSRIGEMFTRISPVTEEETKLVLIDFRHFTDDGKIGRDHIAHLEYLKRWCLSFLWKAVSSQPEVQFILHSGAGAIMVDTLGDVQRLSIGLSGLFFQKDPKLQKDLTGIGEIYIFTTPFDGGFGYSLREYTGKRINVLTTEIKPKSVEEDREVFTLSLAKNGGMFHIPGTWIFSSANMNGKGGLSGQVFSTTRRYVEGRVL